MCEIQRPKRSASYTLSCRLDLISGKRTTHLPPPQARSSWVVLVAAHHLSCLLRLHRISLLTIRVVRARAFIEPPHMHCPLTQHGAACWLSFCSDCPVVAPLPGNGEFLPLPCGGCETHMHTHTYFYLSRGQIAQSAINIEPPPVLGGLVAHTVTDLAPKNDESRVNQGANRVQSRCNVLHVL